MPREKSEKVLCTVTVRLFEESVQILKNRQKNTGVPYQLQLRMLVQDALQEKKKDGKIR
jgi:predicted DNA binding CopG/RHH family protein